MTPRTWAENAIGPQLSRYSAASAAALALDFIVYLVLTRLHMSLPIAGVMGYSAGAVLHYALSTRFVFDTRSIDKVQPRLLGEFILSGLAGVIVTGYVISLASGAGVPAFSAKLLATGASFLVVFALRRYVVFAHAASHAQKSTYTVALPSNAASTQQVQSSAERLLIELQRTTPVMRAAWCATLGVAASVMLFAPITGLTIAWTEFWSLPALAVTTGTVGFLMRAADRWPRFADGAETASILGLLGVFVPLLTCILARIDAPLADARLISWDAAIGLDWLAVISSLKQQEALLLTLSHAYASLMQQPTALVVLLAVLGYTPRLQQFALAWAITLTVTAVIFPLAPALGGYLHYRLPATDFPFVRVHAAWLHATVLEPLRDGSMTTLGRRALEGIVTFPSFHTAAGVLLAWGFWIVPWVRWPALILNALMIAACPIIGGHYFIDVLAGAALAWMAIAVAERLSKSLPVAGT